MLKYYIFVRDSDGYAIEAQALSSWASMPTGRTGFTVQEIPQSEYDLIYANMSNESEYAEHQAIFNNVLEFIDRPQVHCTINKTNITANGTDIATISGLPVGARVVVYPVSEWEVNDGIFEFSTIIPANYILTVRCSHFKPKEFAVSAS